MSERRTKAGNLDLYLNFSLSISHSLSLSQCNGPTPCGAQKTLRNILMFPRVIIENVMYSCVPYVHHLNSPVFAGTETPISGLTQYNIHQKLV